MRTAHKAGFQCLLTFLTVSGVVNQLLELPELSENVLILLCNIALLSFIFKVWSTIKLYLASIKGFNIYKLFGQLIDFNVSLEHKHNCLVQRIYCQLI